LKGSWSEGGKNTSGLEDGMGEAAVAAEQEKPSALKGSETLSRRKPAAPVVRNITTDSTTGYMYMVKTTLKNKKPSSESDFRVTREGK
jgi:hypothetical protein